MICCFYCIFIAKAMQYIFCLWVLLWNMCLYEIHVPSVWVLRSLLPAFCVQIITLDIIVPIKKCLLMWNVSPYFCPFRKLAFSMTPFSNGWSHINVFIQQVVLIVIVAVGWDYAMSLWNWDINSPIVHPTDDTWVIMEQRWNDGKNRRTLKELPVSVPLCPSQILHGLTWMWTQASTGRSWQLTSWAMEPAGYTYNTSDQKTPDMESEGLLLSSQKITIGSTPERAE